MEILKRDQNSKKVKEAYNEVTWYYDVWSQLTEQKAMELGILWAEVSDGETLIDIGCGTGRLLEQIMIQNPHGLNIGMDLSPDMLRKAENRLSESSGSYKLLLADLLEFDFKPNSYDLVLCFFVIDMMPEDQFHRIASTFYKILQPAGRLVMGTFSMGTQPTHRFWYYVAKYFPKMMTYCRPIDFSTYLIEAGFEIVRKRQVSQNTFPSEVILAKQRID